MFYRFFKTCPYMWLLVFVLSYCYRAIEHGNYNERTAKTLHGRIRDHSDNSSDFCRL